MVLGFETFSNKSQRQKKIANTCGLISYEQRTL